jgi:sugar/nucleoside kinase (ribokinase family)
MFYGKVDKTRRTVVGVGSALVDILTHESDAFVVEAGAVKGGMTYVDKVYIDRTIARAASTPKVVPGGSACNTAVGIGRLGGKSRFVGKCGNGSMGHLFRSSLNQQAVEPMLFPSDNYTGRVLSIITPDAQRSMLTFLGASAETDPRDLTPACFSDAAIVHIEGYLLFNPELINTALKAAKAAGALVSLDLASHNVVAEARQILPELVERYVDILIANEDEASAYTGIQDEYAAIDAMAAQTDLAVLKRGARGALIAHGGVVTPVDPKGDGAAVADTTGAGDLWAAGFLYGLVNGMPLELCGELGSLCGYEVCQVVGASIAEDRWAMIQQFVEDKWPKKD